MNRRTFLRMIPAVPLGVAAMASAPAYATGGVVTWVGEGRFLFGETEQIVPLPTIRRLYDPRTESRA